MDDTIYRRAAIEALVEKGQHSRRYKFGDIWELNFTEIRETLNALPAADPKSYSMGYQAGMAAEQRWIPCSEKLTEELVLCCGTNGDMIIGYIYEDKGPDGGYFAIYDQMFMNDCVAWLPLPEPYKGEP